MQRSGGKNKCTIKDLVRKSNPAVQNGPCQPWQGPIAYFDERSEAGSVHADICGSHIGPVPELRWQSVVLGRRCNIQPARFHKLPGHVAPGHVAPGQQTRHWEKEALPAEEREVVAVVVAVVVRAGNSYSRLEGYHRLCRNPQIRSVCCWPAAVVPG